MRWDKMGLVAIGLAGVMVFALSGVLRASTLTTSDIPSLAFEFQANQDPDGTGYNGYSTSGNGTGIWIANQNPHSYLESDLRLRNSPGYNASTGSAYGDLSAAFTFDNENNSTGGNAEGASQAGSALGGWDGFTRTGSTDPNDSSYEFWFKPDATVNADLHNRYIYNTGGPANKGASLWFEENGDTVDIKWVVSRDVTSENPGATATWTLDNTDADNDGLIDILQGDFVQVVAMY